MCAVPGDVHTHIHVDVDILTTGKPQVNKQHTGHSYHPPPHIHKTQDLLDYIRLSKKKNKMVNCVGWV